VAAGGFAHVLLVTGVKPRDPRTPGQDHSAVLSYIDVLLHKKPVGKRVGIVGAGGIGFDMAEYLAHGDELGPASTSTDLLAWLREWGVADPELHRGGVVPARPAPAARDVTLLQRKPGKHGKHGAGLGKTTGWSHRAALKMKQVQMLAGVNYERIAPSGQGVGLFVTFGPKRLDGTVLEFDTLVLCAGQEPLRELQAPWLAAGVKVQGERSQIASLDCSANVLRRHFEPRSSNSPSPWPVLDPLSFTLNSAAPTADHLWHRWR